MTQYQILFVDPYRLSFVLNFPLTGDLFALLLFKSVALNFNAPMGENGADGSAAKRTKPASMEIVSTAPPIEHAYPKWKTSREGGIAGYNAVIHLSVHLITGVFVAQAEPVADLIVAQRTRNALMRKRVNPAPLVVTRAEMAAVFLPPKAVFKASAAEERAVTVAAAVTMKVKATAVFPGAPVYRKPAHIGVVRNK